MKILISTQAGFYKMDISENMNLNGTGVSGIQKFHCGETFINC